MEKEVYSTEEFSGYAGKNLVLVKLDFPSAKAKQPEALKKANAGLKKKFEVKGFPTMVILNSEGKELGREVGYGGGGVEKVIGKIEELTRK